jgi:tripartite-type tricarboxylate transporter receptor subunit TctC
MIHFTRRALLENSALAGAVALAGKRASAQTADFYRGKVIRMLIGAGAGGGFDIAGRLVAEHMPRHIPGNPSFVIENMQGGSSLPMTNYLYNSAPRDGTVMGMPNNGIPLEPRLKLLTRAGGTAAFDVTRLGWIGSSVRQTQVLFVWSTAPVRSLDDLKREKLIVGSEGISADNYLYPYMLNRLLGAQMNIVPGYPGQVEIFLAVERGELQACVTRYSTLLINQPGWLPQGKGRILLQFGATRMDELPDVPTAAEIMPTKESGELLSFFASKDDMASPLALPPDVPPARLQLLRDAFDATMRDPAYQAGTRKLGLDAGPLSGAELEALIDRLQATPETIVERLRALLADAGKR